MPKVIVVDDDEGMQQVLAIRLRAAGIEVIACNHPDAARELVLQHKPDLLLLDIEMPGYTGLEFHECLKLSRRGCSIPVLFMTGRDSPSYRLRAQIQGACGFMTKPLSTQDLIQTINKLVH